LYFPNISSQLMTLTF